MSGMERAIGGEQVLLRVMEKLHEQIYSQDETIKLLMDKRLEQREWFGLTDKERSKIWRDVVKWGDPSHDDEDLMKAIEAKLKEKNFD
jgi:hypothetical protein